MTDSSKRVFISYRRIVAQHLSLLLFKELQRRGYDVFRDYSSIGPGDFERIIPTQIASRDHFILLLTPGTLDRCNYDAQANFPKAPDPDDWIRREIEHAIATGRNIIPLLVDDYNWDQIRPKLTAGIKPLQQFNGPVLHTTHDKLFDTSIEILCSEYLIRRTSVPTIDARPELEEEAENIIENSETEILNEVDLEAERLLIEGTNAYYSGDYKTAIRKFGEVIKTKPDWYIPYFMRGSTYDDLEKFSEAFTDYNRAIELNPKFVYALNDRGQTYAKLGQYDKAIADYNRAIELDPYLAMAFNNRGYSKRAIGKRSEALADYNRAIELNPRFVLALNNRGNFYTAIGNHLKAIKDYSRAVQIDPNDNMAYYNRGATYYELGRYEESLADMNEAVRLDSNDVDSYVARGTIYIKLEQYENAIRDFQQALKIEPQGENALSTAELLSQLQKQTKPDVNLKNRRRI